MSKRLEVLKEMRHLTPSVLLKDIQASRKRVIELNQEKILGKLKDVAQIRRLRRNIARQNTILDEIVRAQLEKTTS